MVVIRPTRRLHKLLPPSVPLETGSTTALGDWYVNRVVVDRRPLLLILSAASLLPIVIPAQSARTLPIRLADLVGARLRRAGVDEALIALHEAEARLAETPCFAGKRADRVVRPTDRAPALLATRWGTG